jgi:hypothetical protein
MLLFKSPFSTEVSMRILLISKVLEVARSSVCDTDAPIRRHTEQSDEGRRFPPPSAQSDESAMRAGDHADDGVQPSFKSDKKRS